MWHLTLAIVLLDCSSCFADSNVNGFTTEDWTSRRLVAGVNNRIQVSCIQNQDDNGNIDFFCLLRNSCHNITVINSVVHFFGISEKKRHGYKTQNFQQTKNFPLVTVGKGRWNAWGERGAFYYFIFLWNRKRKRQENISETDQHKYPVLWRYHSIEIVGLGFIGENIRSQMEGILSI
jgi:hypothetical protein